MWVNFSAASSILRPARLRAQATICGLTGISSPLAMWHTAGQREPGNRADAYPVALGEVARRLAFGEALPRFLDLVRGEFRLTPHPDALGAGNLSAFVGALDDPQGFVLGHCRHHRHETPPHRGGEVDIAAVDRPCFCRMPCLNRSRRNRGVSALWSAAQGLVAAC